MLASGSLLAMPARADDAAIQQEIDALKQRIEALERALAESKKAPPAPPTVPPAPPAAPAAAPTAITARNGSRFQVSGYTQIRFTNVGSQNGNQTTGDVTDFQVTRFRPTFNYQMDDHFLATLQLNAATRGSSSQNVTMRNAYLEYANAGRMGYTMRAGQQLVPYGWEVFREGSEDRAALERARVFAILFPDSRDIGFTAAITPKNPRMPVLTLGVINGNEINQSDNDHPKNFVGNMIVALGRHDVFGASFYSGTATTTSGSTSLTQVKNAHGIENRASLGRLSTQMEFLWGRSAGAFLNGGYSQIAYSTGQPGTLFVRYDVFDPNTGAPHDYWSRTSLGWYKDFTRQFRLTGEYDLVTNRALSDPHQNTWGIQVQGSF
jgi:hypothetical protein